MAEQLGGIAGDLEHEINPDAEVGTINKTDAALLNNPPRFIQFVVPSGSSDNHCNSVCSNHFYVIDHHSGFGKVDAHIGVAQRASRSHNGIDDTDDLDALARGRFLNHLSHLSVAKK